MIYATDLDKTLIFSKRCFSETDKNLKIEAVEVLDGKVISYMTSNAIHLLKELVNQVYFIPVTTRSLEHYNRIEILKNLDLKYFITSNGGRIFVNGKLDEEWNEYVSKIKNSKKDQPSPLEDIQSLIGLDHIEKTRFYEDLFWTITLKKDCNFNIEEIASIYSKLDWNISKVGRKIYIIPAGITKWDALQYVREKYLPLHKVIGTGDSSMDYDLVNNADIGLVPKHGEVANMQFSSDNIMYTENLYLLAGEELLRQALVLTN